MYGLKRVTWPNKTLPTHYNYGMHAVKSRDIFGNRNNSGGIFGLIGGRRVILNYLPKIRVFLTLLQLKKEITGASLVYYLH